MGHAYICYEGPLGAHLKAEVKEKIWKREYIDIFTLLPLERFNVDRWKEGGEGRKEEDEDRRRLPLVKVRDLLQELQGALLVKKVTLRQLQSVLGKLNFACKVLPMGRVFSRRLSLATAGVREPHHFIRLSAAMKEDIRMWITFLRSFDGLAYWLDPVRANDELELFTDAAGSVGFGAYWGRWCAGPWPGRWRDSDLVRNLAFLELFPLVVAVTLWGEVLRNKAVCFRSDNMSVVAAVNTQTSSSLPVVVLLRQLVLGCLRYNVWCRAAHVPGVENGIADALSRSQWERFRKLAPEAREVGESCPSWLLEIL
ncbi:LOW QUALITY PROTEIN: uncharacterized protein PAF06_017672 [Gastrophryne carolinensis]